MDGPTPMHSRHFKHYLNKLSKERGGGRDGDGDREKKGRKKPTVEGRDERALRGN